MPLLRYSCVLNGLQLASRVGLDLCMFDKLGMAGHRCPICLEYFTVQRGRRVLRSAGITELASSGHAFCLVCIQHYIRLAIGEGKSAVGTCHDAACSRPCIGPHDDDHICVGGETQRPRRHPLCTDALGVPPLFVSFGATMRHFKAPLGTSHEYQASLFCAKHCFTVPTPKLVTFRRDSSYIPDCISQVSSHARCRSAVRR